MVCVCRMDAAPALAAFGSAETEEQMLEVLPTLHFVPADPADVIRAARGVMARVGAAWTPAVAKCFGATLKALKEAKETREAAEAKEADDAAKAAEAAAKSIFGFTEAETGPWTVHWESGEKANIDLVQGRWSLFGTEYALRVEGEGGGVAFRWPGGYLQKTDRARCTVDTIAWTTNHPGYPTITWKRGASS